MPPPGERLPHSDGQEKPVREACRGDGVLLLVAVHPMEEAVLPVPAEGEPHSDHRGSDFGPLRYNKRAGSVYAGAYKVSWFYQGGHSCLSTSMGQAVQQLAWLCFQSTALRRHFSNGREDKLPLCDVKGAGGREMQRKG